MTSQIGSLFGAFDELRSLTVIVLMLPFVAAALAPLVHRALGDRAALVLALAPLGAFLHFACQLPVIDAGRTIADGYPWVPSLGLSLSWYLDGLSLTFALLISGIGTLIILYSGAYLKGDKRLGRFYAYMFLFMGSMQGLVIADSFLMLFIFWELTSITSFLLIGFDSDRMPASSWSPRRPARTSSRR